MQEETVKSSLIEKDFKIRNGEIDGFFVTLDYNRPGDPKVLFTKILS